jgi:hypothetical protein
VLTHRMLDKLTQLGFAGMAQAYTELEASDEGTRRSPMPIGSASS